MKELADNISTLNRYLVAQQKEVSATGAWTQTKKDLQMALEVSILGVWEQKVLRQTLQGVPGSFFTQQVQTRGKVQTIANTSEALDMQNGKDENVRDTR